MVKDHLLLVVQADGYVQRPDAFENRRIFRAVFFNRISHSTAGKSEKTVTSPVTSSPVSGSSQVIVCFSLPSAGGRCLTLRLQRPRSCSEGFPPYVKEIGHGARQAVVR